MKRISVILLVLLGSTVMLTSCHKDNNNQIYSQVGDQNFVTDASSSANFEIQAGRLALNHASSDSVKIFADSMVNYNTRMLAQLNSVASQNGFTVSTTLQSVDQNNLNALNGLSGVGFDKQYASIMLTAHRGTLTLFTAAAAANGVGNVNIRSFAGAQLPELQTGVNMSVRLQQYTTGESGQ